VLTRNSWRKCGVSFQETIIHKWTLFFLVPVTDIYISSKDAVHYAGHVITCRAISYPQATYVWFDANNSSIRVNGSVFNITSDMVGANYTLQCNATNTVNGATYSISSTRVDFYVASGEFSKPNREVGSPTGPVKVKFVGILSFSYQFHPLLRKDWNIQQ
jgi:hypothetical protein